MSLSELPKGKLIGSAIFLAIALGFAIYMLIPSGGKPPEVSKAEQAQHQLDQQVKDAGLADQPAPPIPVSSEPPTRRARKAN